MTTKNEIKSFVSRKPFIYYRIDEINMDKFIHHAIDNNKLSINIDLEMSKKISSNAFVFIDANNEGLFIGYLHSKSSSSSFDKIIRIKNISKLNINNISQLLPELSGNSKRILSEKIKHNLSVFSKKLSKELFEFLYKESKEIFDNLFSLANNKKTNKEWLTNDSIKFALSISDVDNTFSFDKLEVRQPEYLELFNVGKPPKLSEDMVINFDYEHGLENIGNKAPSILGKATFSSEQKNENITIYLANKRKIENIFGVDLVYINHIQKNIVMIQYKMLEKESNDWIFRNNEQMTKEINRMDTVANALKDSTSNEYRINPNPFFLRFIKRQPNDAAISFCISVEHYKKIISLPKTLGRNGGRKIGFGSMEKHYIGKKELEGLIRSGYVGTYSSDTETLSQIFDLLAAEDTKNGLVVAFRKKMESKT